MLDVEMDPPENDLEPDLDRSAEDIEVDEPQMVI